MILPDVNLLIYSIDTSSPFHAQTREWWDTTLSSTQWVGLCYPCILGFVRVVTNPRVVEMPLSVDAALAHVEQWMAQPYTAMLLPTDRHWDILGRLLRALGVGANLTTDADIAAHGIEHGFVVHSNDADFGRFPGLQWANPLADA